VKTRTIPIIVVTGDGYHTNINHARTAGADVQKVAMAAGVVFLVVGVLGCIPGVTTGYEDLALAGHESGAELLGIFQVSVLHNLVHLLFGIAGVVAARTWSASRGYLVGGGLAYLVLWVYGQVIDHGTDANGSGGVAVMCVRPAHQPESKTSVGGWEPPDGDCCAGP